MLIWMDGFDVYGYGVPNPGNITSGIPELEAALKSAGYVTADGVRTTTTTRTGYGQALGFAAGSAGSHDANIRVAFTPKGEVTMGFAVKYDDTELDRLCDFIFDNRLGVLTRQMSVYANAQGGVSLSMDGSVLVASSPPNVIFPNVWQYIEIKYRPRKGSAGLVVVRVDGTVVLSYTGSTSQSGVPDQVNMVRIGNYSADFFNALSGTMGIQYIDDLYILDDTGDGFTDFLGDVVVHTMMPVQDAGPNQMNMYGGELQHYTAVDEIGYDDDLSYLYTNTAGHQEFFALGELPANIIDVLAVSVHVRGKKDSPGIGTFRVKARRGSDVVQGDHESLAIQYTTKTLLLPTSPDGTAWTKVKAEETEIGFEAT